MKTYAVFHILDISIPYMTPDRGVAAERKYITDIQAEDLNDCWQKTQNDLNPDYQALGVRSCVVGDVYLDKSDNSAHMVIGMGFKQLGSFEPPKPDLNA